MPKISVETDRAFRVSLPGKSAESRVPEEFAIHSGFDYPKIEENFEGYFTVTIPDPIPTGYTDLLSVRHDYGYKPFAIAYMDDISDIFTTDFAQMPFFPGSGGSVILTTGVDEAYFKIQVYNGSGSPIASGVGSIAGEDVAFKYQIWIND